MYYLCENFLFIFVYLLIEKSYFEKKKNYYMYFMILYNYLKLYRDNIYEKCYLFLCFY